VLSIVVVSGVESSTSYLFVRHRLVFDRFMERYVIQPVPFPFGNDRGTPLRQAYLHLTNEWAILADSELRLSWRGKLGGFGTIQLRCPSTWGSLAQDRCRVAPLSRLLKAVRICTCQLIDGPRERCSMRCVTARWTSNHCENLRLESKQSLHYLCSSMMCLTPVFAAATEAFVAVLELLHKDLIESTA
jgi:hypothetical protein